jgi:DNA polymerase II large subunit
MARGWESKYVEEQMASVMQQQVVDHGDGFVSEDTRRLNDLARTVRERQKQSLHLQRESILHQTVSQPARRAALEAALAQIDGQIAKLN